MKKYSIFLTCTFFIFCSNLVTAAAEPKVFIEDKEVKNNGNYIIKNNKVFVSEDALKNNFGFSVFYDKSENKIRLYDYKAIALNTRSSFFEQFSNYYEPKSPDEAVELWAKGIKQRNGVLQYVVYNKILKNEFKALAEKSGRLAWVTGFSSPWVQDYNITKEKIGPDTWKYKVTFTAVTSAPGEYFWHAVLTVGKEDNKWRIINLERDFDIM